MADSPPPASFSIWRTLRNALLSGFILLAPLIASVFVVVMLIQYLGAPVNVYIFPLLPESIQNFLGAKLFVEVISAFLVLLFVTLVGLFNNFILGRWFTRRLDDFFLHLPVVNVVYRTVKQIVETFRQQKKTVFHQVVLVQFPRPGFYSIGFVTGQTRGEAAAHLNGDYTNVFVPTTPIPTNGFYLIVPTHELVLLNMTVGDGMKLLISGGTVTPESLPLKKP